MSELSKNKKYLNLDNVRVSYSTKKDTIHITSNDQDLCGKPFKLTLNKGTESYKTLKNLILDKGLSQSNDRKNSIPSNVRATIDSRSPWAEIPIGVSSEDSIYWSIKDHPNLTISSPPGTGGNSVRNSILSHCISHNNKWEVYIHGSKRSDLYEFKKYSNAIKKFSNSMTDLFYLVSTLKSELESRLELIGDRRVNNVSFLDYPPKNILFFIEGFDLLEASLKNNPELDDAESFLKKEIFSKLKEIATIGHKASIYIAIKGDDFSSVADSSIVRYFTNTLLLGDYTDEDFRNIVGDLEIEKLEDPYPGRGLYIQLSRAVEVQVYSLPISEIDEWILKFGSKYEPDVFKSLLVESILSSKDF